MNHDDPTPASKGDVAALDARLCKRLDEHDRQFEKLLAIVKSEAEETRRHFDVVAEDLRHDAMGANHDEIDSLKDRTNDHEQRITTLETRPV